MAMPEFSPDYCPDCSRELGTREVDGRKRLYCGECEQVEWLNPDVCAGVIVQKADEFLLQKRGIWPRKGTWSIPAGFLELEEPPLEAAKRETFEETGLEIIEDPEFVDSLNIENPDGNRVIVLVYHANSEDKEGELTPEEDEVEELRFWTLEEMISNKQSIEHEKYIELIKKIKEG